MQIVSHNAYGFQVLRIMQEPSMVPDADQLSGEISDYLDKGVQRIALAFEVKTYPYSKLISVLIRINQLMRERGGTLAVIQPNRAFTATLAETKLDTVFTVVDSEEALADIGE